MTKRSRLNRLVPILAAAVLATAPASAPAASQSGEWHLLGRGRESTLYIDTTFTATQDTSVVEVWTRQVFDVLMGQQFRKYDTSNNRVRVHCGSRRTMALESVTYHRGRLVERSVVSATKRSWSVRASQESVAFVNAACAMAARLG